MEKGKRTAEEKDAILGRISKSVSLEDAKDADLVIEAVVENFDIKKNIFSELDRICPEHTILRNNFV